MIRNPRNGFLTGQTTTGSHSAARGRPPFARILTGFPFSAVLSAVLLLAVGCGRKAPGPEECHDLAVRWVGAVGRRGGDGSPLRRIRAPLEDDAVLERTTLCLTTPYDRELVTCVQTRGSVVQCYRAFEARHGVLAPPPE
jgi:hypothetical protein